jgi:hypothetical protein
MKFVLTGLLVLALVRPGLTDVLQLQSGGHVEGVVIKEEDGKLIVHLKHGIATLNKDDVASITKDEVTQKGGNRFVPWTACFRVLATRPWGQDLRPVPAVVIGSGPMKHVPYTADRGGFREFNLYGDLDQPAAVEIGLSKVMAKSTDARKEVLGLIRSLLLNPKDQEFLSTIDPSTHLSKESNGLAVDIDEFKNSAGDPTCFISVYDVRALESTRVADKDVPQGTTPVDGSKPGDTVAMPGSTSASGSPPGSTVAGPTSTGTTDGPPGTFGFSPGAASGSMPPPTTRSYAPPGVNWAAWWRQHHPTTPKKPKTEPSAPK